MILEKSRSFTSASSKFDGIVCRLLGLGLVYLGRMEYGMRPLKTPSAPLQKLNTVFFPSSWAHIFQVNPSVTSFVSWIDYHHNPLNGATGYTCLKHHDNEILHKQRYRHMATQYTYPNFM